MAGTFPGVANTQQHDVNGQPLSSCLLTVYQGGSTSALANTYQDIGLTIPAQNPLVGDATGRVPLFFVADGSYGLRLTDQNGIQSNGGFFYPQIPSIGASSSGGGGSVVDPTTVFSTGDVKWRLEEGTIAGWVRVNGRTIGNAASGASERANADCQALYIYIWTKYSNPSANTYCPVVGGLGSTALADFNSNKQITLLDARGRAIFGLDDMGNAALGSLTGVTFTHGSATFGGACGGANSQTLTQAQLPAVSPTFTGTQQTVSSDQTNIPINANRPFVYERNNAPAIDGTTIPRLTFTFTPAGTISQLGSGAPISFVPSCLLGTLFWKL